MTIKVRDEIIGKAIAHTTAPASPSPLTSNKKHNNIILLVVSLTKNKYSSYIPVLDITANSTSDATSSIIAAHVISLPMWVLNKSKLCMSLAAIPMAVEDKLTPAINPSRLLKA
jgi:hypothetical protein